MRCPSGPLLAARCELDDLIGEPAGLPVALLIRVGDDV